jgi:hypothetical protein
LTDDEVCLTANSDISQPESLGFNFPINGAQECEVLLPQD